MEICQKIYHRIQNHFLILFLNQVSSDSALWLCLQFVIFSFIPPMSLYIPVLFHSVASLFDKLEYLTHTHTDTYYMMILIQLLSPTLIHTFTYARETLGGVKQYSENLGEFLRGDKIENSAYQVRRFWERQYRNIA